MPRNRWMYYATGLPGWMRFGFGPGWWGAPQAQADWDAAGPGAAPPYWPGFQPFAWLSAGDELEFLRQQGEMLSEQLDLVRKRISELEAEGRASEEQGGEAK